MTRRSPPCGDHGPVTGDGPFSGVVFGFEGTLARIDLDLRRMERQVCALAEAFLERDVPPGGISVQERLEAVAAELLRILPSAAREFLSRAGMLIAEIGLKAAAKGDLFPFAPRALDLLKHRRKKIGIISMACSAAAKTLFPGIAAAGRIGIPCAAVWGVDTGREKLCAEMPDFLAGDVSEMIERLVSGGYL